LEDVSRSKQELEDRHLKLAREKVELATQLQENEEELQVTISPSHSGIWT